MSGGDANGQNAKWAPWRHAMKMRSCCGDGTHTLTIDASLETSSAWRHSTQNDEDRKGINGKNTSATVNHDNVKKSTVDRRANGPYYYYFSPTVVLINRKSAHSFLLLCRQTHWPVDGVVSGAGRQATEQTAAADEKL